MTDDNPTTTAPAEGDDFAALAMLAGLTGATAEQQRLLQIITNPKNSNGSIEGETHFEIADAYEEDFNGYQGFDWHREVDLVTDFLYAHYSADPTVPNFLISFVCNIDGEISGVRVGAEFGTDPLTSLNCFEFYENKHTTTDRDATGLKAALGIAEMLDAAYQRVVSMGRRRGLLATPTDVLQAAAQAVRAHDENPTAESAAALRAVVARVLAAQGASVAE